MITVAICLGWTVGKVLTSGRGRAVLGQKANREELSSWIDYPIPEYRRGMTKGVKYPPPPWKLEGKGALSLWLVPAGAIPIDDGVRPVSIGGRWLMSVACLAYGGGGVLAYNELLVGVVVRSSAGLGVHIPRIWVDSKVSLEGGRALWEIPKEMAVFRKTPSGLPAVLVDGQEIASLDVQPRRPIPRKWTICSRVVQMRGAEPVITRFRTQSHIAWSRARWDFSGPLAFLADKKPFLTLGLSRAQLEFGG